MTRYLCVVFSAPRDARVVFALVLTCWSRGPVTGFSVCFVPRQLLPSLFMGSHFTCSFSRKARSRFINVPVCSVLWGGHFFLQKRMPFSPGVRFAIVLMGSSRLMHRLSGVLPSFLSAPSSALNVSDRYIGEGLPS